MISSAEKRSIAKALQAKINMMQGLGKMSCDPKDSRFSPFADAFPGGIFPTGAIHEFISHEPVDTASTQGFMSALAGKLMRDGEFCLWIASERKIFPSGLKHFGIQPDRIIFINAPKPKDLLWIVEEALKCESVTAVIGEIKELGFTESRRLQLAVEHSHVTGFIHRICPRNENATACTARWNIKPLPSVSADNLPGIGHLNWNVELLKVKNGSPNSWQISWIDNHFTTAGTRVFIPSVYHRNAG